MEHAGYSAEESDRLTDDPDILRAVKLAIERHGADAGIRAARRANELADEGDAASKPRRQLAAAARL